MKNVGRPVHHNHFLHGKHDMNALLGLLVVVAIGIVLWAILVVGGWLMRIILTRTEAIVSNSPIVSSRLLRDLQPMEDWLVDFVSHSPELGDVLGVLAATDTSLPFARIVHKIRIGDGSPADPKIAANLVGAGLCILFMAGLVRLAGDGIVATDVGREVQRRINAAPHATYQPIQAAVVDQRTPATHAQEPSQIHEHGVTSIEKTNNMNNRNIIMTDADRAEMDRSFNFGASQPRLRRTVEAQLLNPLQSPPQLHRGREGLRCLRGFRL
jgi:hypothetical protein